MMISLLYIILAVLGLGVLIFFHELGHYYMARRVGMKVDTFAIGFGKPIYSWYRDGVKWQLGWLPFGGYVKLAGETQGDEDPYSVPDGYLSRPPIDRIKMLFAGPFVNLVLAFLIFTAIWLAGGREKNFGEFTNLIGWVDPKSELYAYGVRPGDEIVSYDNHTFQGVKDHLYAPMTSSGEVEVVGYKVDYATGERSPFNYNVRAYPHPNAMQKGILTAGILNSANYILYDKLPGGKENPLPEGSPMQGSGIQYGDRILWVDGEIIFSGQQLNQVLNDGKALLTIVRDGVPQLKRVPRVEVEELRMDSEFREEVTDWQFEANLNATKLQKLYAIPYNLTNDLIVENQIKFIDRDKEAEIFSKYPFSSLEAHLLPRDRIIAIDGKPIKHSYELLSALQRRHANVIVEKGIEENSGISWQDADKKFAQQINWKDIQKIAQSIGTVSPISSVGNYHLLKPVEPKMRKDFSLPPERQALATAELLDQKKAIEAIEDPEKRSQALTYLQNHEKQLLLGLPAVQDERVRYNPNPFQQFVNVFTDIWRMLVALVTGSLNVKWMSGPIGIVQVVHDNWQIGIKEALFWLGAISLNLGVLNLLPVPVLDGGSIVFAFVEMVTGRRVPPKVMEKINMIFAILLIGFFIFLTYQDLGRVFGGI